MSYINKVILVGNLGQDPNIRTTNEGKEIVSFSLATTESWKDKLSGEKKDKTEWHRIVIFNNNLVNITKNYLRKGSKIYLEGALQTRKWVDKEEIERYTTEIVLQNYTGTIRILDSRDDAINSNTNESTTKISNLSSNDSLEDDEIPF